MQVRLWGSEPPAAPGPMYGWPYPAKALYGGPGGSRIEVIGQVRQDLKELCLRSALFSCQGYKEERGCRAEKAASSPHQHIVQNEEGSSTRCCYSWQTPHLKLSSPGFQFSLVKQTAQQHGYNSAVFLLVGHHYGCSRFIG